MTWAFRASAENDGGPDESTSITVAKPSGVIENDLMYAVIQQTNADVVTGPSGWARIDGGSGNDFSSWYKVAGASEPVDYTWTAASAKWAGAIVAYSGVDTSDPLDVTGLVTSSFVCPDVTADLGGALVIRSSCEANPQGGSTGFVWPTSTERVDILNMSPSPRALSIADAFPKAAGATGTETVVFTISGVNDASETTVFHGAERQGGTKLIIIGI